MKGVIFATGTVSAVDTKNCRARVRLPDHDNLRSYWLDVLHRNTLKNRDYNLPDVGEQVKVMMTPDAQEGVILGAVYSEKDRPVIDNQDIRRTDFADNAYAEYDRKNSAMTIAGEIKTLTVLTRDVIRVETGTEIHVKAKSDITVDTAKTVTVTAAQAISVSSQDNISMTASADMALATRGRAVLVSSGTTTLKSSGTTIDAPATTITGSADIGGGLTVSGGTKASMTGSASISQQLTVGGSVTAGGVVAAAGFTSSAGSGVAMQMTGDIQHKGSQQTSGDIRAGGGLTAGGDVQATGGVQAGGSVQASGDVTAGSVSLNQTDKELKALQARVNALENQIKTLSGRS